VCIIWCAAGLVSTVDAFFVHDPVAYQRQRDHAERIEPTLFVHGGITNVIQNDTFDDGLTSWVATGSVVAVGGEAELQDDGPDETVLHQLVPVPDGTHTISFDVQSSLSDDLHTGAFLDTFFASLYFTDTPGTFDLENLVFDDALGLLDVDANGPDILIGALGPSPKGLDWQRFSASFANVHGYVAVAFDLADGNTVDGDSSVRIDNVTLLVIPEPSMIALLGVGLSLLSLRRRRNQV
jgi:hypothetical protein